MHVFALNYLLFLRTQATLSIPWMVFLQCHRPSGLLFIKYRIQLWITQAKGNWWGYGCFIWSPKKEKSGSEKMEEPTVGLMAKHKTKITFCSGQDLTARTTTPGHPPPHPHHTHTFKGPFPLPPPPRIISRQPPSRCPVISGTFWLAERGSRVQVRVSVW